MCTLRGLTMYDANENCSVKIVHLENLCFVFGLNAILLQVSQHMMSSMLEMERLSLC